MPRRILYITIALLTLSACASQPAAVSHDGPSGKWSGNYELGSDRREPISVDLQWEKENLSGTVHAGARELPLTKTSFNPGTQAIHMEFDTEGPRGQMIHYVIDGKIDGNTMTGTWTHDEQQGAFRVTRQ